MVDVLPGILEKEWEPIERKIELVKPFAKGIHIDLLDGKFAPNTTWLDPTPFAKYSKDIFFELHMMVFKPIDYINPWAKAGIRRFIGHIEHMADQEMFVKKAKGFGEVGLAIDAKTQISAFTVDPKTVDSILVMTVSAGFSGQAFLPECLEKVRVLAKMTKAPIEIDGGVNDVTLAQGIEAGVTRCVATSFLFSSDNPREQYELLTRVKGKG